MTTYRLSVIENGIKKNLDTNMEEFDFYALRIGPSRNYIRENPSGDFEIGTKLFLQEGTSSNQAATKGQVDVVRSETAAVEERVVVLEDNTVAARLLSALDQAAITRNKEDIAYLYSNRPLQEYFVASAGGQTMFTANVIKWDPTPSIPDIQVFINAEPQYQDLSGNLDRAFRKISSYQIEFSEVIPEGNEVMIRQAWDHFVNARTARLFSRNYITGQSDYIVWLPDEYEVLTGRLGVYRNGIYMAESPFIGAVSDRYVEKTASLFEVGLRANNDDVFTAYHLAQAPTYKVLVTGLVGTDINVLAYTMGDDSLRVYRNGQLMNRLATGDATLRYTEVSATQISLAFAAQADEYFIFECASVAPQWREDFTGITDPEIHFQPAHVYTNGDKKLQVFRNGVSMYDSTVLGGAMNASMRYQENGAGCIILETAPEATETITCIYL